MILKVNRNSDHERKHDCDLNQWLYIDKIESFDTRTFIPHTDYKSYIGGDQSNSEDAIYEYLELNYSHVVLDPNREKDGIKYDEKNLWIDDWVTGFVIYNEDDSFVGGSKSIRMSIVFNTYAYLMNDQGQTIEKFTH